MIKLAGGALLLINLITFALMGIDKRRAIRKRWRIPEKTLLGLCACFGALGGLLGMRLFRHKTRHPRFSRGIPILLALQVLLLAYALGGGRLEMLGDLLNGSW